MPKTIKLESHLSSQGLELRYRKARDPVLRSHYQILRLIGEGETTTQVMEATGYSRGRIQQLAPAVTTREVPRHSEIVVTKTRALRKGHCSVPTNRRNSGKR